MLNSRPAVGRLTKPRPFQCSTPPRPWRRAIAALLLVTCALTVPTSVAQAGPRDGDVSDLLKEPETPAKQPAAKKPAAPAAAKPAKPATPAKPAAASGENAEPGEPGPSPDSGMTPGASPDSSSSMSPSMESAAIVAPVVASTTAMGKPTYSGVYSLEQFGPITTPEQAQAAFEKAGLDISSAGGGVLLIPVQTPAAWQATTMTQRMLRLPEPPAPVKKWGTFPGVTVVDQRKPGMFFPTQVTGWIFTHKLRQPPEWVPPQGVDPAFITLKNQVLSGTSDVTIRAMDSVEAGSARKVRVQSIQGLVPGQVLQFGQGATQGSLTITALGFDKGGLGWHIVGDLSRNLQPGELLSCITEVNTLVARTSSNNENQTFDTMIWKQSYGQGPHTLVKASYRYMGDNASTENGRGTVLYHAEAQSLTEPFEGTVESYDPATSTIVYKDGASHTETISSGRPIINLNPSKQIRVKALVQKAPDRTTILEPGKLGQAQVGWYVTVDEPDYMYPFDPQGQKVRCWHLITDIRDIEGKQKLGVLGYWWGATRGNSLGNMMDPEDPNQPRPVTLIIAPGAMVNDASEAVQLPNLGVRSPKRLIRVVEHRGQGTASDFAPGDRIQQAIATGPWPPVIFRSWLFERIPSIGKSPMFDVVNAGAVQRDMVMHIHGTAKWGSYFHVNAQPDIGILFNRDVPQGALVLQSRPDDAPAPLSNGIIFVCKNPGNSGIVTNPRGQLVLRTASGAGVSVRDKDVRQVGGLNSEAGNFRAIAVAVEAGKKSLQITFEKPETSEEYLITVRPNWVTNFAIRDKKPEGFTIVFDRAAGAGATVDWLLVR